MCDAIFSSVYSVSSVAYLFSPLKWDTYFRKMFTKIDEEPLFLNSIIYHEFLFGEQAYLGLKQIIVMATVTVRRQVQQ